MKPRQFIGRLFGAQAAVNVVVMSLVILMAPQLLVLPSELAKRLVLPALETTAALVLFSGLATFVIVRRLRDSLDRLSRGEAVPARDLLEIDALPSRLSLAQIIIASVFSSSLMFPSLVAVPSDLYEIGALAILVITFISVASLPLYVFLRRIVARVLERAPLATSHAAIELVEQLPRDRVPRVRSRFLLAAVGPVAFVALGVGLVAYSHVRAFESTERRTQARLLVEAALEPVGGSLAGQPEAILVAKRLGFRVQTPAEGPSKSGGDARNIAVVTPEGRMLVGYGEAALDALTLVYLVLAALGGLIAGILGSSTGAAFTSDLGIAARSMRVIGVDDVIKGTKMVQGARFRSVVALLESVDALGDVFRRFASAHERSIVARRSSERMRGLFLASMSHDLKAPLNAILGFSALVKRKTLSEGQIESLTIVEQRGRELLHLIHTVLDSARLEDGALEFQRESVAAGDVVMSAVLDSRDLAVGSDVTVEAELQPNLPYIFVDSTRAVQALTAIVMTAARFTVKGTVHVRAALPPSVTLEVGENIRIDIEAGGGVLPDDERDKLFDAFHDAERARKHGGLGLGLSLGRQIVERMGGTVTVEAFGGAGLVFQVWFPLEQPEMPSRRPSIRPRSAKS